MRKSKLDNPEIKDQVIKRLAIGEAQKDIARSVGISQSRISRCKAREDIKPFIEQEQMKLLEVVPDAVENVKGLVREFKNIPEDKIKRWELAYKASVDVLKAVGLMPSPVQSLIVTNIYNQQNNLISSRLSEMLKNLIPQDVNVDLESMPCKD